MKSACWILVSVIFFLGCNGSKDSFETRLKAADRIDLSFFTDGGGTVPVSITDRALLDSMAMLVSETKSDVLKCGYDGKIQYRKGDSILFSGDFNLSQDCGHIAFTDANRTEFRKLAASPMATLARIKGAQATSKLDRLAWFLGKWMQVEGPDLVSYEEWNRFSDRAYLGTSCTLYHTDTVHQEVIELISEGEDIFYIPTVKENNGPVRFKLTTLEGRKVVFENPTHDFPQKITYEAKGDSMLLAVISGAMNGKEASKEFPLRRVTK